MIVNTDYVSSWKSKGLSAETIKSPTTSDNSLTPELNYYDDPKVRVKFTKTIKIYIQRWHNSKYFYRL